MTATPILETLAKEFKTSVEHVRNALEMLDAGLSSPFIGRFRRDRVGGLSESLLRRLDQRRRGLEELDRRRGTILRLLEKEEVPDAVRQRISRCMDRFELEDLFLPYRRPEPEVQLALDRGLGALADLLTAPRRRADGPAAGATDAAGASPDASAAEPAAPDPEQAGEAAAAPPAGPAAEGASAEGAPSSSSSSGATDTAPADGSEPEPPAAEGSTGATQKSEAVHQAELNAELARLCQPFVSPDKGIHDESEALSGAMRILSDRLGRDPRLRGSLRRMMRKRGVLTVRPLVDESKAGRHRSLLNLSQPMNEIQGHRLLALRQAQRERILTTRITVDREQALEKVRTALVKDPHDAYASVLEEVAERALDRRLLPMLEEDIRLELKERADTEALRFLSQHLREILLAPRLARHEPVCGIDVSAKGDFTVAAVDADGMPVGDPVRIETGEKPDEELGRELAAVLSAHGARSAAVGNAKGARAALPRIRRALRAAGADAFVYIVNEAGVSSYANSETARRELGEHPVPARMAISLARRLQDPLAEILKVDPRHLGLGTEQGLVSKANVKRVFRETIESCVALTGCDVSRAPAHVLAHVPGLDRAAGDRIVERRAQGPIRTRDELREEGVLTEAQWTSAIAFLRVPGSEEPLDRTGLHPELYPLARRMLEAAGASPEDGLGRPGIARGLRREDFDVDEATWRDLVRELQYPGRDPRQRLRPVELLDPQTDPARLVAGRVVEGIVSNVTSFGAFVDVGLEQDAMIHISEISERYVRDARELLAVGQIVRARILDGGGQRLTLSLKKVPRQERPRRESRQGGRHREARPAPQPNVRAAQTRRDGLAGARSRDRGGRRGGPGGRGPGGRGRHREEGDERVDLSVVNRASSAAPTNPFAAFFRSAGVSEKGAARGAQGEKQPSAEPSVEAQGAAAAQDAGSSGGDAVETSQAATAPAGESAAPQQGEPTVEGGGAASGDRASAAADGSSPEASPGGDAGAAGGAPASGADEITESVGAEAPAAGEEPGGPQRDPA